MEGLEKGKVNLKKDLHQEFERFYTSILKQYQDKNCKIDFLEGPGYQYGWITGYVAAAYHLGIISGEELKKKSVELYGYLKLNSEMELK